LDLPARILAAAISRDAAIRTQSRSREPLRKHCHKVGSFEGLALCCGLTTPSDQLALPVLVAAAVTFSAAVSVPATIAVAVPVSPSISIAGPAPVPPPRPAATSRSAPGAPGPRAASTGAT